jgi:hypothetical protein
MNERRRRSWLIGQLCRMSHDGWADARFDDYHPLEEELKALNELIQKEEQYDRPKRR